MQQQKKGYKMININELTLGQVKELQSLLGGSNQVSNHPYKIGEAYLIRTVTFIALGKLEWVGEHELVLSSASWVADTDRFYNALKDGKLKEVEPFINDEIVGRGSIVDATIWTHPLPREQK